MVNKVRRLLRFITILGDDDEVDRAEQILKMYLLLVQLDEMILLETVKQMTV